MLSLDSSQEDEQPVYALNYILAETFKSFYATVDGLTIDPVWIPEFCVNKDLRIKHWWIKQFKEGKTGWKKVEKKVVQKKLKHFFNNEKLSQLLAFNICGKRA